MENTSKLCEEKYGSLESKTLALFFTRGMSLKRWDEKGMLSREVAWYNELAKFFKKIYFFTYGDETDLNYQNHLAGNIVVVPNKMKFLKDKNLYSFLLPFIHRKVFKEVDILKTNQMDGSWSAVIAKKLFNKPLVVRTGYTWSKFCEREGKRLKRWIVEWVERIAYSNADAVIVTSQKDLDYLKEKYKLADVHSVVIPNYVDTELFKPMNVKKKPNSLCYVGRLTKQKNLQALLEALEGTPYSLDIIGKGEEEENLKRFAKEHNLKVNFLGTIPNHQLPEVLNRYEAFVLPSLYEGMPKALLEAMACGLPVVAADVEGIREVVSNKVELCETDSRSIRKSIVRMMKDRSLYQRLGEDMRKTILLKFSMRKLIEDELNLYLKIYLKKLL
jgi:glycosyltransferase involved in cell wall biosynthesis